MAPFTLALLCSALSRILGRWYSRASAPLLALSTGPLMVPALWQGTVRLPFTPGYPQIQASFSSGFCSGRSVLALVRSVVPHTLALLHSAFGRWCLRQCALQQRCPCRSVTSQASYRRVALRPCCSNLLLKLEGFQNPKLTQNTKSTVDALVSLRNH